MTYLPFFALSLYIVKIDVGHSVTISGGGLQVTYNIDQFHFHWGENSSIGSEHTIDSQHYPLEVRNMIMTQLTQPNSVFEGILTSNYQMFRIAKKLFLRWHFNISYYCKDHIHVL